MDEHQVPCLGRTRLYRKGQDHLGIFHLRAGISGGHFPAIGDDLAPASPRGKGDSLPQKRRPDEVADIRNPPFFPNRQEHEGGHMAFDTQGPDFASPGNLPRQRQGIDHGPEEGHAPGCAFPSAARVRMTA